VRRPISVESPWTQAVAGTERTIVTPVGELHRRRWTPTARLSVAVQPQAGRPGGAEWAVDPVPRRSCESDGLSFLGGTLTANRERRESPLDAGLRGDDVGLTHHPSRSRDQQVMTWDVIQCTGASVVDTEGAKDEREGKVGTGRGGYIDKRLGAVSEDQRADLSKLQVRSSGLELDDLYRRVDEDVEVSHSRHVQ
jgi:hypothetical protein